MPPPASHLQFPLRISDWGGGKLLYWGLSTLRLGLWGGVLFTPTMPVRFHRICMAHRNSFFVPPWDKPASVCSSQYSHVSSLSHQASRPVFKLLKQMLFPSPKFQGTHVQLSNWFCWSCSLDLTCDKKGRSISHLLKWPLSTCPLQPLREISARRCVVQPLNLQCGTAWHLFCYCYLEPPMKTKWLKLNILLSSVWRQRASRPVEVRALLSCPWNPFFTV